MLRRWKTRDLRLLCEEFAFFIKSRFSDADPIIRAITMYMLHSFRI